MARQTSDYTKAASAVVQNMDSIYDAARSTSFKPDEVAKTIQNANTERYKAFIRSSGELLRTKNKNDSQLESRKRDINAAKEIHSIGKPARMAGKIAGLGKLGVATAQMKSDIAFEKELRDQEDARWEALQGKIEAYQSRPTEKFKVSPEYKAELARRGLESDDYGNILTPKTDTVPTVEQPKPIDTLKQTPAPTAQFKPSTATGQVTATASQAAAFNKIYELAKKDGRAKFPEIVAAQAMHETGWLSPDLKSVYNSTGGLNPFGQTGDRGKGTIARAGDSNGWSKYDSLQGAVSDHITLWHDTNNHKDNYNAHNSVSQGLAAVIPAYSPNSDPANKANGFTENAYQGSTTEILRKMGFAVN